MDLTTIDRGCVVTSVAGRDEGREFVVLDLTKDGQYAVIADGKLRKVEKPKTKKLKHLRFYAASAGEDISGKIQNGTLPGNAEVRKALKMFSTEESING